MCASHISSNFTHGIRFCLHHTIFFDIPPPLYLLHFFVQFFGHKCNQLMFLQLVDENVINEKLFIPHVGGHLHVVFPINILNHYDFRWLCVSLKLGMDNKSLFISVWMITSKLYNDKEEWIISRSLNWCKTWETNKKNKV